MTPEPNVDLASVEIVTAVSVFQSYETKNIAVKAALNSTSNNFCFL